MIHIIYIYFIVAALIMGFNLNDDFKNSYIEVFIIPIFWLPYTILIWLEGFEIFLKVYEYIYLTSVILGIVKYGENVPDEDKNDYLIRMKEIYNIYVKKGRGKFYNWLLTKAFKKIGAI